jgi:hypothetical protein
VERLQHFPTQRPLITLQPEVSANIDTIETYPHLENLKAQVFDFEKKTNPAWPKPSVQV